MKTTAKLIGSLSAAVIGLLFTSGCGNKEETAPPVAGEPATSVAAPVADAQKAAGSLKDQATAATAKAQEMIDTAKKLTSENKWDEALKVVNDLANYKLTPEQQTLVDNLKAEVQKQLQALATKKATDEAGKAVGGLLKPKK